MRYSNIVHHLDGPGYKAWDVHMKAKGMIARGGDVILLTIGDPDFATPDPIIAKAVQSLHSGRTHYTPSLGESFLRQAIAERHSRQIGQAVTSKQVAVVAGAQGGLYIAARCLLQAGDEAILSEPVYSTYQPVIGASGATPVFVPLRPELGFHFDPSELAAAITPATRAILVNTPHNPTGAMLGGEELETLADLCFKYDLWLISDEVYANFAYSRPHLSLGAIADLAERTVVISSLSKSHAMTGWRIGWVIAPPPLIQYMGDLQAAMHFGLPPFVQDAALYALENELAEVEAMRNAYRRRRDRVCALLRDAGALKCLAPEGGIYVLLDVRQMGMSAYEFAHALVEHERVALLPGEAFGTSLAGYLRLSLTAPEERLEEACRRIQRFGLKVTVQ
jgi:arginine:pyruvate transaminase